MSEEHKDRGYNLEKAMEVAGQMQDLVGPHGNKGDYDAAHDLVDPKGNFEPRVVDAKTAKDFFISVLKRHKLESAFNSNLPLSFFNTAGIYDVINYGSWILVARDLKLDDDHASMHEQMKYSAKQIGWDEQEMFRKHDDYSKILVDEAREAIDVMEMVWQEELKKEQSKTDRRKKYN